MNAFTKERLDRLRMLFPGASAYWDDLARRLKIGEIRVVYIASPYTLGDKEENVRRQIDAAQELANRGFVPFWPLQSHFWHMIYPRDYDFWLELDLVFLERSDAVVRLPGESKGADLEVARAKRLRIPVFYSIVELAKAVQDAKEGRINYAQAEQSDPE